jgi:hypothetical protein
LGLRILVDEDAQSQRLVARLRKAGHDVSTAKEAGLEGSPDLALLQRAAAEGRVLLTRNTGDFRELHGAGVPHAGILGIFFGADPGKDLSDAEIARAIGNLEGAELSLNGQFYAVNAWRW